MSQDSDEEFVVERIVGSDYCISRLLSKRSKMIERVYSMKIKKEMLNKVSRDLEFNCWNADYLLQWNFHFIMMSTEAENIQRQRRERSACIRALG